MKISRNDSTKWGNEQIAGCNLNVVPALLGGKGGTSG